MAPKEAKEILQRMANDGYYGNHVHEALKMGIDALEKQKEQKPLSTEETELNSLAFLEQIGYTCIPPGKEHKPAEWSDWDERIRQTLLDCYEEAGENYASLEWLNGITYGELCYWLEHLRASLIGSPARSR